MTKLLNTKGLKMAMLLGVVSSLSLLVAASSLTSVFAANIHFIGKPQCNVQGNTLSCSYKVAGLGNIQTVTVQLTADVFSACVNKGDNFPTGQQGTNVAGPAANVPVSNGQITHTSTITATSNAKCNGQGLQLCFVFTNVVLHVGTTELSIPGTFSNCNLRNI